MGAVISTGFWNAVNFLVSLAWISVFIRVPFHQRMLHTGICRCMEVYPIDDIQIVRYTLTKPPDLQSKRASLAIRFAAVWYSVLQISPGWIPSLQLTHFSITANSITSDSYLPSSVHICHLPHGSHPIEKLINIFMLEKLWTRVFMGTGIYYLCGKWRNVDGQDGQVI